MSAATFTGDPRAASSRRSLFASVNWIRAGISAGILLTAGLLVGVALLVVPPARQTVASSLGLGWTPIGGFTAITFLLLFNSPALLIRRWRWWSVGAISAAIAVIALSLVQGNSGVFYTYGLAGEWGYRITAGSPALATVELLAGLTLISMLAIPGASRAYGRGLRFAAIGTCNALIFVGLGLYKLAAWSALVGMAVVRKFSSGVGSRYRDDVAPTQARPLPEPMADVPEPEPAPAPAPMPNLSRPGGWQLPPLETLAPPEPHHIDGAAIAAMSDEIKEALAEYGVYVDVEDVKAGPRVIRFGLVPGYVPPRLDKNGEPVKQRPNRVRVGDIAKRQKDLALALKSPYIRIIETPEPGEGLVGLEGSQPFAGQGLDAFHRRGAGVRQNRAERRSGLRAGSGRRRRVSGIGCGSHAPPAHRRRHRVGQERLHQFPGCIPVDDAPARRTPHDYG